MSEVEVARGDWVEIARGPGMDVIRAGIRHRARDDNWMMETRSRLID